MIVADSNLIAYLLIPGEKSLLAESIFLKDSEWAVPLLCRSEIRNIVTLYMRQQQMTLTQAKATLEKAELVWKEREFAIPTGEILELTSQYKVSAYDAEFVVLAKMLNIPLLTFDQPLRRIFPMIAVDPMTFA